MPNYFGRIVFILFAILVCLAGHAIRANADTTLDARNSITNLLENPSPLLHEPRSSDVDAIAAACAEAEAAYGVPCLLLVAMMHHESRFDSTVIGKRGEIGLLQVHGAAARGCDLATIRGQVFCGAAWLQLGRSRCSDWWSATHWYASSSCGDQNTHTTLDRRIDMRIHLWQRLQKNQNGDM